MSNLCLKEFRAADPDTEAVSEDGSLTLLTIGQRQHGNPLSRPAGCASIYLRTNTAHGIEKPYFLMMTKSVIL